MFDYLFYRMYYWNTRVVKDFTPLFSAILCTSIFIGLNLVFLNSFIFFYLKNDTTFLSKQIDVTFGILSFLFCNFYFRMNKRFTKIIELNNKLSAKEKRKKDIICIIYISITFILFIWITIKMRMTTIGYL